MTLKVYLDTTQDGSFADDISADIMDISWRLGMRNPYQLMADEMTLTATVVNTDGKYNPENTSTTLSGTLIPNTSARVEFVDAGGTTVMWRGFMEIPDIPWKPAGTATGKVEATLRGVGPKHLMDDTDVDITLYQNVTADEVILDVINATAFPATVTDPWILGVSGYSELGETTYLQETADFASLETGVSVFPYYGDNQRPDGWSVIEEVVESERGRFFFDRDGIATFWNRQHFVIDTGNDGTVATDTGNYKPIDLNYTFGKQIVNHARITAHPRQVSAAETLWELDAAVTVEPGQQKAFYAELRKSSGQYSGASEITQTHTFSSGTAIVEVRTLGGKVAVGVDNSSGTIPAVLGSMTLTGQPVVSQNNIIVEVQDEDSIGLYQKHTLALNLAAIGTYEGAEDVAKYEVQRRKDARGEVNWLKWTRAADGSDDAHLLDWPIGTRLNVSAPELSHDADYFVIGEEHKWRPGASGNGVHTGKLYLEPADAQIPWILGVSGFSELGQTTYIGF